MRIIIATLLLISGCASWPHRLSERPCCIDIKPVVRRQPIWWHLFDVTVLEPIEQPFHLIRFTRKLFGAPIRSINLKHGWLSNSIFVVERDPAQLSLEQVRWGPSTPDDAGVAPFKVTKLKTEGKTAGLFVKDARGVRYLFKFDPIPAPELLSGAEVVTSKLLYALGYHVPSYEVAFVRPEDLSIDPGAIVKDVGGKTHALSANELEEMVQPRLSGGTLRVSASKILSGELLGPARFKQFRDCAEIRALKVAYAWVNNIDTKDHNSLLIWNGKEAVGYIIDFGTSLGADAGLGAPKTPCAGWLNIVDLQEMAFEILTLGLHQKVCDTQRDALDERVGLFTAHIDPDRWKPYAPNVAFDAMNKDDAVWIAKRLARVSRDQIASAVSAGKYTRPGDAEYLIDVLDARRKAIVERYLGDH